MKLTLYAHQKKQGLAAVSGIDHLRWHRDDAHDWRLIHSHYNNTTLLSPCLFPVGLNTFSEITHAHNIAIVVDLGDCRPLALMDWQHLNKA